MKIIERAGVAIAGFRQKLQVKEAPKEPVTPYAYAQRLWDTIDSHREIDPVESALFEFHFTEKGVKAENEEQDLFTRLMLPYRSLFPELGTFAVSLSIGQVTDNISFKVAVFASPPSPRFNQKEFYPVLAVRELPQQKGGDLFAPGESPYNLLILAESDLYSGQLDQELLGLDQDHEPSWQAFKEWHEGLRGDVGWRRQFAIETLKYLTNIVEPARECVADYNKQLQAEFRRREKSVPWWDRTLWDRMHPGAVWPDDMVLFDTRRFSSRPPARLVACLQQA